MIKKYNSIVICVAMLLGLASPVVNAESSCTFLDLNGTLTNFGGYVSGQVGDLDALGEVHLICNDPDILVTTIPVTVAVDGGEHGTIASRALSNGLDNLQYNLFVDPLRINVLGDGTGGSQTINATCLKAVTCVNTVYGRINGGQFPSTGSYTDDVIVSITF